MPVNAARAVAEISRRPPVPTARLLELSERFPAVIGDAGERRNVPLVTMVLTDEPISRFENTSVPAVTSTEPPVRSPEYVQVPASVF